MASHAQTKAMLGVFKADGTLHAVIDSPGSTTHYSDAIYSVVEADTIDDVLKDKPAPSAKMLERALPEATEVELETVKRRLDDRKVVAVEISK